MICQYFQGLVKSMKEASQNKIVFYLTSLAFTLLRTMTVPCTCRLKVARICCPKYFLLFRKVFTECVNHTVLVNGEGIIGGMSLSIML